MTRTKIIPEMEGFTARWYARQRGSRSQLELYRRQTPGLTAGLADGAAVLEVAPGPGYQAIELARSGRFRVTGLDVSHTFVRLAAERARAEGVEVDFQPGDVARMPFADASFDLIVCQAAFKNFTDPVRALDEMHRVLRAGGEARIQDMSRDATNADIDEEVRGMRLSTPNAWVVRTTLRALRRRAHAPEEFRALAARSQFRTADITTQGIGLEVRLTR